MAGYRLFLTATFISGIWGILPVSAHDKDTKTGQEQVGTVNGEPVYRDQIRTEGDFQLDSELHRLFAAPLLKEYREQHKSEITPTEAELTVAQRDFDAQHRERIKDQRADWEAELDQVKQQLSAGELEVPFREKLDSRRKVLDRRLKPPGRFFAEFMLDNWKFQRHLYQKFGGGRLLWQQAGVEAFDAMHTWIKKQEDEGRFEITDPALRTEFYKYWNRSHGPFMIDDEESIQEWLNPEWVKPTS